MKRAKREPAVPKAWRDAYVPVPTTPRDPEGAVGWVALFRVYGSVAGLGASLWLPHAATVGVRITAALAILSLAVIVGLGPARWLAAPLVRRGKARSAFALMRFTALDAERRAAAIVAAALALAHRPASADRASELDFLEEQLELAVPRGARGLVAHALLRALRGDHASARASFEMLATSPRQLFDSFTRGIALTWLCADYARRGDFTGLARLQRRASRGAPAIVELLGAVARRVTGSHDAPSNLTLRLRYWLAPRRRATRALVERALRVPRVPASPEAAQRPSPDSSSDALTAALIAHKVWLVEVAAAPDAVQARALLDAASAWDAFEAWLASPGTRRSAELDQMSTLATSDLSTSSSERDFPLWRFAGQSALLDRAYDISCENLFREIDAHVDPLRRRVKEARGRTALEEWVEWATLRQVLERAHRLGGDRVRRGAFAGLHRDLTSYAVWLYNTRRFHLLAHTIFHWLLVEARWMNDEEAIALCAKNVRVQPE